MKNMSSDRFFYADERSESGGPVFDDISASSLRVTALDPSKSYLQQGTAHAEEYWNLADGPGQSEPFHTFVKSKGYQKF